MEKGKREIQIKYPDGSYHNISVYRADSTLDGRVVLSYYDLSDQNQDSFTEIIYSNGTWYKNPNHLDWSQYAFAPFDQSFSNGVLWSLPNKVEMMQMGMGLQASEEPQASLTTTEPQGANPNNPNELTYITMAMFANEGESTVNLKPSHYENGRAVERMYSMPSCTAFLTQGQLSGDLNEVFYRAPLSDAEKRDIYDYIKNVLTNEGKLDISSVSQFIVNTSTNKTFVISPSSCSDWRLFLAVKAADCVIVDENSVSDISYPDYFSSAMHYELPMEMMINGNYQTNGVSRGSGSR